ncbi:putative IBR domain, E3 ubiquitin ligase RBR family, TRIAD supradomain-containing protein [Helianthus annuus]|nr:putative IBR domain, E3 ubiquitin ligase RBR family, TRIAD supradomain-containing protein [Helianthus annuus]KAJ0470277.1 putative IBR domain, E3 ubiquitin ligase RBR family, TRIAD supradomain-containing protein [Helianthus annuus]KAJ0487047.1 putative IBR domain, E3 ubiquitin ligase RBR family, TRIAD supradomain-containing protein [Helianthus annuus]KAJ0661171.1 putative IBR domain, E3 ubiquitin ligase RBR family, TRIAD supradomain-containing protein [Helianthus annuus]KAJ0841756.1 putative
MSHVADGFDVYVCTAVEDGPGCLTLRCPEPSCEAAVGPDMVRLLASENERKRYDFFLLRTYVESNKRVKWCPGPGCEYAVEYDDDFEFGSYDVSCNCKYGFCWKCMEDALIRWIVKPGHDGRACNGYAKEGVPVHEAERQRELAKKAIGRYTHYYERWAANEKSRKEALTDLHKIETVDLVMCWRPMDDTHKHAAWMAGESSGND